jgi:hypothetical protein
MCMFVYRLQWEPAAYEPCYICVSCACACACALLFVMYVSLTMHGVAACIWVLEFCIRV